MLTKTVRINHQLLQQAVQISGLATQREVVESALRLLIQLQSPSTATVTPFKPLSRTADYHPEVVKRLQTLATVTPLEPPQETEELLAWLKQEV